MSPEPHVSSARAHGWRVILAVALVVLGGLFAGFGGAARPSAPAAALRLLAWIHVMVFPGLGLYLLAARSGRNAMDACLAALGISPVLVAGLATLLLWLGMDGAAVTGALAAAAALLIVAGLLVRGGAMGFPGRREVWAFVLLLAATAVLVAWLPATREWWRIRSDAWFHAAVTMQIRDFGAPPEDPYFAGMSLQYMWAYHAMTLALGRLLRADYFQIMAVVNLQALALLGVAAWRLAAVFRTRAAPRLAAVAVTFFAFNAAFWVFLPMKLARALIGDVRGMDEVARTFRLFPLDYRTSWTFLETFRNPPFFLDKFMVATAFGLALALFLGALAAGAAYVSTSRRVHLATLAACVAGTLLFHTYVGLVAVAAFGGAAVLLFLFRTRMNGYVFRFSVLPVVAIAAAVVVAAPFVYDVTRSRDVGGSGLVDLSFQRLVAILVPCVFVMVLAWWEGRVRTEPSPAARFVSFFALATLAVCLVIHLPGPNNYAKPAFPVFLALAPIAGLAVADTCTARHGRARARATASWILLFALPVNLIAFAGAFGQHDGVEVTPAERTVAKWAIAHTPRRAVFIDEPEHVFLLVTGPRRYLFGSWNYASQWKYPRAEMARRFHAMQSLYAAGPLDRVALEVLADIDDPLYVIVRPEHRGEGAAVTRRDDLFPVVFDAGGIQVREVNRAACRAAVAAAPAAPAAQAMIEAANL